MRSSTWFRLWTRTPWVGVVLLGACATDELKLAPPRAEVPWPIPQVAPAGSAGQSGDRVLPQPGQQYALPELIDMAQRSNPETRQAWEQARQAALAVGLAESAYAPQLSAEVLGGYQHTPLPIPATLIPKGYFTSDTRELVPALALKWLLFDFGGRAGAVNAARENSFVANVAFTGAHQKLIFTVSRDYYALSAARGKLRAAEQSLKTAMVVEDAVTERRKNGLATTVDLAQAKRQTAQARFNRERAIGAEHAAYEALINSMGVDPGVPMEIAEASEQPLPNLPESTVDRYVRDALSSRPDVVASLGKVRAAEAGVQKERASHYPTVALAGHAYQNLGDLRSEGSPWYSVDKPGGDIGVMVSLPLFDGGLRKARDAVANSELAGARAGLEQARDAAIKQVRDAYDNLKTSLAECAAATALVDASQSAYDSALDAYRHGVGTYTSLVNEETALAQAQADLASARSDAMTSASALAFATGSILRGDERPSMN
ncbi:MAG: Outer rane efflux protein [Nevskia sp.]|nr:Outer rane efflux protein [Nevskia sp.]